MLFCVRPYRVLFRKAVLAAIAAACSAQVAHAVPAGTIADKYAAIVVDANNGKTLFQYKANLRRYPASLTKMMTLYLLFEAMKTGRVSRNTPIPVSSYAASRPPTKMGLLPGQRIAAESAAKALIARSANDIAAAIGEYLGGSEKNFARMMTAKARKLGMKNTHFSNASGLPDPQNYSTARDMAILSLALRRHFPNHYKMFNMKRFSFRGSTIDSHNRLVKSMQGVDGIKTGYTRMSGFNLASSRRYAGKSIVAVVMGGSTALSRDAHMADLLERYMAKASSSRASPLLVAGGATILSEGSSVPIPVSRVSVEQSAAVEAVATSPAAAQTANLPEGNEIPVPIAKISVKRGAVIASQQVVIMSDREHDSALLTALASQDFIPSAAAAVDEIIIKKPPVPSGKTAPGQGKGWIIQIASLPSQNEADRILGDATGTVRAVSAEARPYTQIFKKGASEYYRVRFRGFSSKQAAWSACSYLEKKNFSCYALKE